MPLQHYVIISAHKRAQQSHALANFYQSGLKNALTRNTKTINHNSLYYTNIIHVFLYSR